MCQVWCSCLGSLLICISGQINGSHSSLADTPVNTVLPGILAQSRNSDIVGSAPHVTSLDEKHGSLYSSTPPARDGVMRRPEDTITLLQEFDLVNFDYPGIIVHEVRMSIDWKSRRSIC